MRRSQQGVVLFIALIILVAMSLAGVALMRRVDTGNIIANNLAFRQAALHAGDAGVESARTWLLGITVADKAKLDIDNPALVDGNGYFAQWAPNLDLLGTTTSTSDDFDWSGANAVAVTTPAPPAGYTVKYVIHRLCKDPGNPAGAHCITMVGTAGNTSGSTKGAASFGTYAINVPVSAIYRVTVRVSGPRNSISYIQAVVS